MSKPTHEKRETGACATRTIKYIINIIVCTFITDGDGTTAGQSERVIHDTDFVWNTILHSEDCQKFNFDMYYYKKVSAHWRRARENEEEELNCSVTAGQNHQQGHK